MNKKNAWEAYDEAALAELESLSADYIDFISANKTERECVATAIAQAREAGYISLDEARAASFVKNSSVAISTCPIRPAALILGASV